MDLTNQFVCTFFALIWIYGVLVSPVASQALHANDLLIYERYEQWMAKHGRVYEDTMEKERRFKIFKENVEHIESFNAAADKPYKLGINQFADRTNDEFKASLDMGFNGRVRPKTAVTFFKYENVTTMPSAIDWRKKGAVTPIKSMYGCGCSYAFSAVAAVEGITKISTGKLISLSEQQLVDCDTNDNGCNGGSIDGAFKYIIQNQGITAEANYPYGGANGTCNTGKEADHAARISKYEDVPTDNEEALLKAVANQPVSVTIDASCFDFQFYAGGVLTSDCGTLLNLAVSVVGYGVHDGIEYWLVKNIWDTEWGESGYIQMQRNVKAREGLCGIAMRASYPLA